MLFGDSGIIHLGEIRLPGVDCDCHVRSPPQLAGCKRMLKIGERQVKLIVAAYAARGHFVACIPVSSG
jgi:hypothetical protein